MSVKFKRLSPKLIRVWGVYMDTWTHAHFCPGCASLHHFFAETPDSDGNLWQFNGSSESPTFTPEMTQDGCAYSLKGGKLHYRETCTHHLAGRVIDLPDIPHKALAYMPEVK